MHLGIARSLLQRWKEQAASKPAAEIFPGHGRATGQAQKVRELEKKLRDVTTERDILKKALADSIGGCIDMVSRLKGGRYGSSEGTRAFWSSASRAVATMEGRSVAERHRPCVRQASSVNIRVGQGAGRYCAAHSLSIEARSDDARARRDLARDLSRRVGSLHCSRDSQGGFDGVEGDRS